MPKKKILIAAGDKKLAGELAARSRRLGLEVHSAYDADAALAKLADSLPDLVCVDLDLTRADGGPVAETMAADACRLATPMILLTADRREPALPNRDDLCAYFVRKGNDAWRRIEPVIQELLDLEQPVEELAKE